MKSIFRLIALLSAFAVGAASCGGSGSEGEAAEEVAASETETTVAEASGEEPAEETTTVPTPDPETTESEPDGAGTDSGGDCIIGDWVIEQPEMQGFYNELAANAGGLDMTFTIDGSTGMSFHSDGSLLYTPEFELVLDTAGISGEGSAGGQLTGTYTAENGIITTEVEESDLTITVNVGGVVIDQETMGDLFSSIPINSAPYHCTDEGPAIEFETGVGTTHLVQLTPA